MSNLCKDCNYYYVTDKTYRVSRCMKKNIYTNEYSTCPNYTERNITTDEKGETPHKEEITHPSHYNHGKYEPVYVIRDWKLNFNLGNVVKYIARAGHKDDILVDLKKARQYLDYEIEAIEEERKEVRKDG